MHHFVLTLCLLFGAASQLHDGGTRATQAKPDSARSQAVKSADDNVVVDDFETYKAGATPDGWKFIGSNRDVLSIEEALEEGEEFYIVKEGGNKFLRASTHGEALRFTRRNGVDFNWSLEEYPLLKWRWRANKLPEGASEDDKNDSGGALYVTFGTDWIGRPKSIKYVYSSSLPVGTVVSHGPLKVIVVDSAREPDMGEWQSVLRDVRSDYRQVFGGQAPDRPVSITLWSDSDTTQDSAEVDFDDIELLPPLRDR